VEGSSPDAVLTLVARARGRLRAAAVLEGFAGPAAVLLLVAAAVLAVSRAAGRADLPAGFLAATAALAFLAGLARTARSYAGAEGAALHLDRALGAGERFVTVLETAGRDPALAAWAARGAMDRARDGAAERALALRPPAALLPLVLAAALTAGLALLPSAPPASPPEPTAVPPAAAGVAGVAGPSRPGPGGAGLAAAELPDPRRKAAAEAARSLVRFPTAEDARPFLEALEKEAQEARSEEAARALREAREALGRGDREAAAAAVRRAVEAIYASAAAVTVPAVTGVTGGGEADSGDGGRSGNGAVLRAGSVPLRAREAVRKYFLTAKE